jgi:hypothetical protein
LYFHGGEMPGYNSFMGYDPVNDVTLIVWTRPVTWILAVVTRPLAHHRKS